MQTDLRNAGAYWVDREVVRCDEGLNTLVTSPRPADLDAFCRELATTLAGPAGEAAKLIPVEDRRPAIDAGRKPRSTVRRSIGFVRFARPRMPISGSISDGGAADRSRADASCPRVLTCDGFFAGRRLLLAGAASAQARLAPRRDSVSAPPASAPRSGSRGSRSGAADLPSPISGAMSTTSPPSLLRTRPLDFFASAPELVDRRVAPGDPASSSSVPSWWARGSGATSIIIDTPRLAHHLAEWHRVHGTTRSPPADWSPPSATPSPKATPRAFT